MDKDLFEKMLKALSSPNDTDAVMGLRALQGHFQELGASLEEALRYAAANASALKGKGATIDAAPAGKSSSPPPPVTVSGMPQCRAPKAGHIEIILSGKTDGQVVALPGAAADAAEEIAVQLKDALVAAVINKSRFKLKLLDIKNARGDIVETVLQAEYERAGMSPVRVWGHTRGEVATLATVLRKAVANSLPDLVAA